jgi:hypothetical protein
VRQRHWLFPGQSEDWHLDPSVLQAACRVARAAPVLRATSYVIASTAPRHPLASEACCRGRLDTRQWRCGVAGNRGRLCCTRGGHSWSREESG